ncbi:hypothetical protein PR048_020627 [Dryococelus australis]|uniref:Uncharacterized protein n=1 Tax=Dryococelus australis TaxID=614101 RepID=A0ABQ9H6T5_9NEOP|nr:hypothetical protein PR048_020627 [Dryococelus australis]
MVEVATFSLATTPYLFVFASLPQVRTEVSWFQYGGWVTSQHGGLLVGAWRLLPCPLATNSAKPNLLKRTGFNPGLVTPEISQVGIVTDCAVGRRIFSGISSFPPPFHSGAARYSPRFTGSQDLEVKSRPNICTLSTILTSNYTVTNVGRISEQISHGCAVFFRLVFNMTSQEYDSAVTMTLITIGFIIIATQRDMIDCKSFYTIKDIPLGPYQIGSPLVDDRPIMNVVMYWVVSDVVWTNRTMVSPNTNTNRTGVLAAVDIAHFQAITQSVTKLVLLHQSYGPRSLVPASLNILLLKTPVYLELFLAFEAERRGSVKGDTATRTKSPIATKRKALDGRAEEKNERRSSAYTRTHIYSTSVIKIVALCTRRTGFKSRSGHRPFRLWESCRTMPLVGEFSRGSPVSPATSFRRRSIFTYIALIGSQDLALCEVLHWSYSPAFSECSILYSCAKCSIGATLLPSVSVAYCTVVRSASLELLSCFHYSPAFSECSILYSCAKCFIGVTLLPSVSVAYCTVVRSAPLELLSCLHYSPAFSECSILYSCAKCSIGATLLPSVPVSMMVDVLHVKDFYVKKIHKMFANDEGIRMMKRYNRHIQFMPVNTFKNHIKKCKDSSFESQQVMSVLRAASMVADYADDYVGTVNANDRMRDLRGLVESVCVQCTPSMRSREIDELQKNVNLILRMEQEAKTIVNTALMLITMTAIVNEVSDEKGDVSLDVRTQRVPFDEWYKECRGRQQRSLSIIVCIGEWYGRSKYSRAKVKGQGHRHPKRRTRWLAGDRNCSMNGSEVPNTRSL